MAAKRFMLRRHEPACWLLHGPPAQLPVRPARWREGLHADCCTGHMRHLPTRACSLARRTAEYMGPELLHDDGTPSNGRYDPRATDVWAAGAAPASSTCRKGRRY